MAYSRHIAEYSLKPCLLTGGIAPSGQSLRNGDCTATIVGGVSLLLDPETYIRMLTGTPEAEGVHHSADRGQPLTADPGITLGIRRPKATLIRQPMNAVGWDPVRDRCQYFECHGTGTQAGDPVEAQAIQQTFYPKSVVFSPEDKLVPTSTMPLAIRCPWLSVEGEREFLRSMHKKTSCRAIRILSTHSGFPMLHRANGPLCPENNEALDLGDWAWTLAQRTALPSRVSHPALSREELVGDLDKVVGNAKAPTGSEHIPFSGVAAYALDIISAEDAMKIAYYRGLHTKPVQSGGMPQPVGLAFPDA
ncbi:uncharacterized protein ATNIH1004_001990 [Aspergillus tanneri]|uniref:Beta-ketoacyl synthase C-terminal domain-containing protein n=1 Tax=Aspergillus tanneri TaxID=1220188 RepID=A0A5M9M2Q6_9EURO|nr:uncharacterized protein ATNIH1004_001990 [Aspergillus tanneri]KAA8641322.1 hypothetical protein ATNIH1004_001990 [Aspergillus tanneri]